MFSSQRTIEKTETKDAPVSPGDGGGDMGVFMTWGSLSHGSFYDVINPTLQLLKDQVMWLTFCEGAHLL